MCAPGVCKLIVTNFKVLCGHPCYGTPVLLLVSDIKFSLFQQSTTFMWSEN